MDIYDFGMYWQMFVDWFLAMPLIGQIMLVVGIFAALVLVGILVYYIVYGVGYLVYYILKGVYYLIKYILLAFYKVFEALYYAISGKEKPVKQPQAAEQHNNVVIQVKTPEVQKSVQMANPGIMFCTECGNRFTNDVAQQFAENGLAFCTHCGKGFKSTQLSIVS
jgi:putative hemolysin